VDVTFFFSAKKKVSKEKTRDLVTRHNVSAAAIPVLSARYAMSHFSVALGSSEQFFCRTILSSTELNVRVGSLDLSDSGAFLCNKTQKSINFVT